MTKKSLLAVNPQIGKKTDDGYEFLLKRNCSISPKQLAVIFIVLGLISIFVGTFFYSLGATLILPFSCLEVLALTAAYFYNAVHANDYERLIVGSQHVYFKSKLGHKFSEETFLKSLARILPSDHFDLIKLSQGRRNIHFGKNIHSRLIPALELEVRQALRS